MTSSWRWQSDDEFCEHVQPHVLSKVPHVRHSYFTFSFAQSARRLFEDLARLREVLERLESQLDREAVPDALPEAQDLAIEICHFGERVLILQKRLVIKNHAYGFLHSKEAIPHAAHKTDKPITFHDLRRLAEDTREMLAGFAKLEEEDADFLVTAVKLPDPLNREFCLARDLFSVGFDDIGLLVAGRGLEGVLRKVLIDRSIRVSGTSPARAKLYRVIETMETLHWQADKKPFLPPGAIGILHWLRETRNIGAHAHVEDAVPLGSPRHLAILVAQVSDQLWHMHKNNRHRQLVQVK